MKENIRMVRNIKEKNTILMKFVLKVNIWMEKDGMEKSINIEEEN